MTRRNRHIRFTSIIAITAIGLVLGFFGPGNAESVEAHGKELTLTVTSLVPDRNTPLRRMYRVKATYSGDLDLVEGADVVLTGTRREGGEQLAERRFIELPGDPGVYLIEVVFDRFGDWELQIDVNAELGQGEGSASLIDSVTPVVLSAADQTSLLTEADRV